MKEKSIKAANHGGPSSFVLFVAWLGALVYFVQRSEGFEGFLVAFVKACIWPALVMHRLLTLLNL